MNKSISDIKKELESVEIEKILPFLDIYRPDKRKGVQNIITSLEKKLNKHNAELERIKALWEFENIYSSKGYKYIAGLDEVGRGPLAGPVVAASVILPPNLMISVDDSKKLSPEKREQLYTLITENALSIGVGIIESSVIDEINILEATKLSMLKAIENMPQKPDYLLLDALTLNISLPQRPIIGGDGKSASIAAASIVAKVTRDRIMEEYHLQYPAYGFISNKGYGTEIHMKAIREEGLTPIHRRSFLKGY